jgi:hypothetical protein
LGSAACTPWPKRARWSPATPGLGSRQGGNSTNRQDRHKR